MALGPGNADLVDKLEQHDRYQLELKLEYPCDPGTSDHRFVTEAYFFVPENLEVHAGSYSAREFYADLRDRLRFRTPRMSLEELLDQDHALSPLARLAATVAALPEGPLDVTAADAVTHHTKMLSCVLRARLRDVWNDVERGGLGPGTPSAATGAAVDRATGAIRAVLTRYRALADRVAAHDPADEVVQIQRLLDSYLSLTAEAFAVRALATTEAWPPETLAALRALAGDEDAHRRAAGYRAVLQADSSNEEYVYRHGMLKKLAGTVLYLTSTVRDERHRFETWAFAIAAGIAMAFATAVMFWASSLAPVSWSLFTVLVVSYMAKDRLKELFKGLFTRWGDAWLSDHSVDLTDPLTGQRIGAYRQKFHFVGPQRVPEEVRHVRALHRTEFLAEREFGERVFLYRKAMRVRVDRLVGDRRRVDALVDVVRFNFRRFLHAMDEPTVDLRHLDRATGVLEHVRTRRTYHVNLVLRYGTGRRPAHHRYRKVRVVLTRDGIERVEPVATMVLPAAGPPPEAGRSTAPR